MKQPTKMLLTGAATLLGVALATGGAYAATGSLTTLDVPGRVLQVSGVGPASEHASANGLEHANPNAKGLFGWSTESTREAKAKDDAQVKAVKDKAAKDKAVSDKAAKDKAEKDLAEDKAGKGKADSAGDPAKFTPSTTSPHSSSGDDDADERKSSSSGHVEAVAPDDAVEVDHDDGESDDKPDDSDDSDDSDASDTSDD